MAHESTCLRKCLAIQIFLTCVALSGCATFYSPPEPAPWLYDELSQNSCPTFNGTYQITDWARLIWGSGRSLKATGQQNSVKVDFSRDGLSLDLLPANLYGVFDSSLYVPLLKKRIFTLYPTNHRISGMYYELASSAELPKMRIEEVVGCQNGLLIIHTTNFDSVGLAYNIVRSYETIITPSENGNLHITKRRKVSGRTGSGATVYGVPSLLSIYGIPGYEPNEIHDIPDQVGIVEYVIKPSI